MREMFKMISIAYKRRDTDTVHIFKNIQISLEAAIGYVTKT
jgi:hypothetical protein